MSTTKHSVPLWNSIPCDTLIKQLKQQVELLEMIKTNHGNPDIKMLDIRMCDTGPNAVNTKFVVMCSKTDGLNYFCSGDVREFELDLVDDAIKAEKQKLQNKE